MGGHGVAPKMLNTKPARPMNGTKPHMMNGTMPFMGNGTMPPMMNGTKPHMMNGTKPHMGNGTKHMMNGTMPKDPSNPMNRTKPNKLNVKPSHSGAVASGLSSNAYTPTPALGAVGTPYNGKDEDEDGAYTPVLPAAGSFDS